MRAIVIIWTHYHMNITFESPYKTFWFFLLFEKPKKPKKLNKTRVLLRKPCGLGFFIKNPGFFQPCEEVIPENHESEPTIVLTQAWWLRIKYYHLEHIGMIRHHCSTDVNHILDRTWSIDWSWSCLTTYSVGFKT